MVWGQGKAEEEKVAGGSNNHPLSSKLGKNLIISFASGKGGTGKTFIATNVASSIKTNCQLLDCDVEAPNAGIFLKPSIISIKSVLAKQPKILEFKCNSCSNCVKVCQYSALVMIKDKVLLFPEQCHFCGACLLACPKEAIAEESRTIGTIEIGTCDSGIEFASGILNIGEQRASPIILELKSFINLGKQLVLIDSPPGTSCPMVSSVEGSSYCVLVTEPTPFGLSDLKQAVGVLENMNIPFGVILNRVGFGNNIVEKYCQDLNIRIIEKIPYDNYIAKTYSEGELLTKNNQKWADCFYLLSEKIIEIAKNETNSNY